MCKCKCSSTDPYQELYDKGYRGYWQNENEWRSKWGIFGIRVQIKQVRIQSLVPEMPSHLVSRWKTVYTI